jgi:hypothetical protein
MHEGRASKEYNPSLRDGGWQLVLPSIFWELELKPVSMATMFRPMAFFKESDKG